MAVIFLLLSGISKLRDLSHLDLQKHVIEVLHPNIPHFSYRDLTSLSHDLQYVHLVDVWIRGYKMDNLYVFFGKNISIHVHAFILEISLYLLHFLLCCGILCLHESRQQKPVRCSKWCVLNRLRRNLKNI